MNISLTKACDYNTPNINLIQTMIKNMEKTIKGMMAKLNTTKDPKQREIEKKAITTNIAILQYWKHRYMGDKIRETKESVVKENKSDCGCNENHDCGCGGHHKH